MATATTEAIVALTAAHRAAQAREAAKVAAIVAAYFRYKVDLSDPDAVQRWLALVIPRILAGRERSSALAVQFGNTLRRLELPGVKDDFRFAKAAQMSTEQLTTSLMVTGPTALRKKIAEIERLDQSPSVKRAMTTDAMRTAEKGVAGSTVRHIQNAGRQVIRDGAITDPQALGYIRVTTGLNPCWFCAMLASRGLVYTEDSFDQSDPRFESNERGGTAKVHDSCGCGFKPAYTRQDPVLEQSAEWTALWESVAVEGRGWQNAIDFRNAYEARQRGN